MFAIHLAVRKTDSEVSEVVYVGFDEDFVLSCLLTPQYTSVQKAHKLLVPLGRRWFNVPTWTPGILTDVIRNSPRSRKANSKMVRYNGA